MKCLVCGKQSQKNLCEKCASVSKLVVCKDCGKNKLPDEFYVYKKKTNKRYSMCKDCFF